MPRTPPSGVSRCTRRKGRVGGRLPMAANSVLVCLLTSTRGGLYCLMLVWVTSVLTKALFASVGTQWMSTLLGRIVFPTNNRVEPNKLTITSSSDSSSSNPKPSTTNMSSPTKPKPSPNPLMLCCFARFVLLLPLVNWRRCILWCRAAAPRSSTHKTTHARISCFSFFFPFFLTIPTNQPTKPWVSVKQ